jgi:serine/threonine protein kinase
MSDATWRIPGYVAEDLIGFGAAGEVWRGHDLVSGDVVALKRLRVPDDDGHARLRREAALLAALDHPHLLRLRDTVCTDDRWVLVLDYAAGSSLAALLLDRGRLRPGEIVTALSPVAAALAYAHSEGLVHGDVTPANVLFTSDGRPLLADLGIARVVCDEDPVRATPEYVDPAVAAGAAPGPATDVFAVGAIAFHALTGEPPWVGPSAEESLYLAASGDVPDLAARAPDVLEALVRVVQRALSAEPAHRGSAAELALELRHACAPEPVELRCGPTSVPPAAKPAALTHDVRPREARLPAEPTRRRHRRVVQSRRSRAVAACRRALSSKGLRAAVLGALSVALAVRLGIAWAGARPAGSAEVPSGARSTAATNLPTDAGPARPSAPNPTPSANESAAADPAWQSAPFSGSAQRWANVLSRLDVDRQQAFAKDDSSLLNAVYTPASAALAADQKQLGEIRSDGARAVGVHHQLYAMRLVSVDTDRAVLDVREALLGYQLRHGTHVVQRAGSATRTYQITLLAHNGGWRIDELTLTPRT